MSFSLHSALARDSLPVAQLTTSELRLMNDRRFPWCLLVPRIADLSEWHQLPVAVHQQIMAEICLVSEVIESEPEVTKLNVGALGNRVPQLHIHVLGRHPGDPAWPDPVWGNGAPEPYREDAATGLIERLRKAVQA